MGVPLQKFFSDRKRIHTGSTTFYYCFNHSFHTVVLGAIISSLDLKENTHNKNSQRKKN